MLSFKDLQEVLQPKAAGEKRFKDKHVADTIDYPLNDAEINKGTKKSPAKKKRIADSEEGKDAAVYEENDDEMTPAQEKKREEIVMAMKKDKEKLQSRYGESWKAVMYATATKQAMSESFELDEAIKGMSAKDEKALENYMKKLIAKMSPEDKEKIAKDPKGAADFFFKSFKQVASKSGSMKFVSREEVELDEAINPKDKKVVDAFYDGKSMDGKMLSTDGKKLEKTGMGGQTIASKSGNKFKIVAKMDSKSTQDVVKYIEKSFPKNVIEEVELDEALPPHLAKYIGKDGDFTPEVKKRLGKDFMKRMQVPSKKKSNVKDVTPKGYGPNEELDESAAGIAQLKKAYEPLRGKKISLDNAKKLSAIMDKFADDKAMLMKLVKADIPFVTQSAVTKLITKHNMKGAEINKMKKEEKALTTDARYKTFREKLLKLGYQKADIDEDVGLDEANLAKMSDDVLKSRLSQMEKSLKTRGDSPAIQFEIKRLKKEMKKRGIQEEVDLDEAKYTYKAATSNGNTVVGTGSTEEDAIKDAKNKAKELGSTLRKRISMKKEDVDLDEAFKINPVNIKLNDGSMVKISKDDASVLNGLYNSLNPANAKTMIKKMMQDKKSYGEILAFAKQAM